MDEKVYALISELESLCASNAPPVIRSPSDVFGLLITQYGSEEQEVFLVITLDGSHRIINTHVITRGLVNRTLVHPREVFRPAIKDNSTSIIIAHNHPSGALNPSAEDFNVTETITEAGHLLGITVLDHILFSFSGARSIKDMPDIMGAA